MEQLTIYDYLESQRIGEMSGRTAFIDECGSFGFDFSSEGNSKYYLLCAVIVDDDEIDGLHEKIETVKKNSGFANTELKSSKVGNNIEKRNRIVSLLSPIPFRVILFVADKERFAKDSPITEYKQSFIKFLHQRFYDQLYKSYPKLKIIEDEVGSSEFQTSFRKYVENHRPEYNLFNQYDFDYTDSKDEVLVQLADFVGGTINKYLVEENVPNYVEMLRGKIVSYEEFPNKQEPYWGKINPEDCKYDKDIYTLSVKCARDYIEKNNKSDSFEIKARIVLLKYLLFYVENIDPVRFVSSYEVIGKIQEVLGHKTSKTYLFRRIIAPLRDDGVILSSCNKGYKIPVSMDDIITYFNQTHSTVAPMLHRIEVCRNLIQKKTIGKLDVLDDPAFSRYKRYFD